MSEEANLLLTKRLKLRRYIEEDIDAFIKLFTDRDVMQYVDNGVLEETTARELFKKIFSIYPEHTFFIWAVLTQHDDRYIGHAELKMRTEREDFEIVYIIDKKAWGQGFGTETAKELLNYGFDVLHCRRIIATIDLGHTASIQVAEKIGMVFDGEEWDEKGKFLRYAIHRDSLETV